MYPEQTVFRRIVHVQEHHQPAFAYIILSLTYLLTVSLIMFIRLASRGIKALDIYIKGKGQS